MNLEVRNTPRAAAWSRGRRASAPFSVSSGNTGQDFVFTGGLEKDSNETAATRSSIK
jgi:hypothetical protein